MGAKSLLHVAGLATLFVAGTLVADDHAGQALHDHHHGADGHTTDHAHHHGDYGHASAHAHHHHADAGN